VLSANQRLPSCGEGVTAVADASALRHAAMRLLWLRLWDLGCGPRASAGVLCQARPLAAEVARGPGRPPHIIAGQPTARTASSLIAMLRRACAVANGNVGTVPRGWPHGVTLAGRRSGCRGPSVPALLRGGRLLGVLRRVLGVADPRWSVGWRRQVPLRQARRCRCCLVLRLADLVILDEGVQSIEILRHTTV